MQKTLKQIFLLVCITLILTLPYFVFATNPAMQGLTDVQPTSGFADGTTNTTMAEIVGKLISAFLSLLGVIFIGLIINGGYNWMYAGGDTGKLDNAKNTIRRAIIGLIIIVASFSFWVFIEKVIYGA